MKYLRVFPDAATRDTVLANINYGVLSYTEGIGIKIKAGESGPDYSEPFYVENITETVETVRFKSNGAWHDVPIQYSTDKTNWELSEISSNTLELELNPGDKIYIRAEWCGGEEVTGVKIQGASKIGGNILSLLYYEDFVDQHVLAIDYNYIFSELFEEWSSTSHTLIDAGDLLMPDSFVVPGGDGYNDYCFCGMFIDCTLLTAAPVLPATTLNSGCYERMFSGCESLSEITIYADDISAFNCLNDWLYGVASEGQFHNLGTAIFDGGGSSGCPINWTADHPEYVIPLD